MEKIGQKTTAKKISPLKSNSKDLHHVTKSWRLWQKDGLSKVAGTGSFFVYHVYIAPRTHQLLIWSTVFGLLTWSFIVTYVFRAISSLGMRFKIKI